MGYRIDLRNGDCLEVMRGLADCSVDSCVCDPPYHLVGIHKRFAKTSGADRKPGTDQYGRLSRGFMGETWDGGDIAFRVETWAEVYRVLKPGGHLLAFSGTRTYHRMAVAIEDAGFEIRDQIGWMFGSGFPKSHDVAKGIDKAAGLDTEGEPLPTNREVDEAEVGSKEFRMGSKTAHVPQTAEAQQWDGWGTALKPAWEPICVARKPLIGTVVDNVLKFGTGALNIDGCRVPVNDDDYAKNCSGDRGHAGTRDKDATGSTDIRVGGGSAASGRWPANIAHDGSAEVIEAFAQYGERGASAPVKGTEPSTPAKNVYGKFNRSVGTFFHGDAGTAARFFYCAKASRADRDAGCEELPDVKVGMVSETSGQHVTRRDGGAPDVGKNNHPTVKPTDLMRWLTRLVTPPDGLVLDPFMGSGSTGRGAVREGFRFLGIELSPDYLKIAEARIAAAVADVEVEAKAAYEASRQLDMFALGSC